MISVCVKSEWTPPPFGPPWIELPLSVLKLELCSSYNHPHHFPSNKFCFEFHKVCSNNGIRILAADKNLGPATVANLGKEKGLSITQ